MSFSPVSTKSRFEFAAPARSRCRTANLARPWDSRPSAKLRPRPREATDAESIYPGSADHVILAVCRLVGSLFRKFHQPRVVGEMFAGILLGPSLLGWIAPQLSAYLFPPSSLGFLNALSQVGVVIFMFLVGLGINPKELKHQSHAAVLMSHVSITAPFVLASYSLFTCTRGFRTIVCRSPTSRCSWARP